MATSSRPTRVRAKLTADNRESVAAARKPASGPSTNILPHALPLPITHNPAISEAPVPALGNKRSASQPASEVGDESSNEDEAPLKSKKKRQTNRTKKSDVYPTDMYKDVDDMDMDSESDTEPKKKKDPTADINEFWTKAPYIKGDKKGRRICKLCHDDRRIADECTTLRRHSAAFHKREYLRWCKANSFESMLPDDAKARKVAHLGKLRQTAVHDHYKPIPLEEKPEPYSDELFKKAAIEWLIMTDQPLNAFEHPAFKKMIDTAALANKGAKTPN